MPEEIPKYRSDLTGPELDEALRNVGKVQDAVQRTEAAAQTAEQYGKIVEQNQTAIQAIEDNLADVQGAAQNAADAKNAATSAAASASAASQSASDAEDSAKRAEAAAGVNPSNYYTKVQADTRFAMPVGYIFEWSPVSGQSVDLSTPEKVAQYFGYGTWAEFAPGQVLAGVNDSHRIGTTVGAEKHAITKAEMPAHEHGIHGWSIAQPGSGTTQFVATYPYTTYDNFPGTTRSVGGGQAMSLMQPTRYVYRWQRIA